MTTKSSSAAVYHMPLQENATFLIDPDKLPNRKDVFSDDNGMWTMKGSRSKSSSVEKDGNGQVMYVSQQKSGEC